MPLYEKIINIDKSPERFKPFPLSKEFIKLSKSIDEGNKLSKILGDRLKVKYRGLGGIKTKLNYGLH